MSGVSAFLWQAALILLVAYFLGAWIGCFLRRLLTGPPKVVMEAEAITSGLAAGAAAAATGAVAASAARASLDEQADRFGRALDGGEPAPGTAPPKPKEVGSLASLASAANAKPKAPPEPPPAPAIAPAEPATPASPPSPDQERAAAATSAPEPRAPAAGAPKAPSLAPNKPVTPSASAPGALRAPSSLAPKTAPPTKAPGAPFAPNLAPREPQPAPPAQEASARRLPAQEQPVQASTPRQSPPQQTKPPAQPGAPKPAAPASSGPFTPPMSAAAAAATERAKRLVDRPATAPDLPASTGTNGQAVVSAPIERAVQQPQATDDLSLINGVSAADIDVLKQAGVTSFAAIAALTAPQVRELSQALGSKSRIARENWIEQAALLQSGTQTAYAMQRSGAEIAQPSAPPVAVPPPQSSAIRKEAAAPASPSPEDLPAIRDEPRQSAAPVAAAAAVSATTAAIAVTAVGSAGSVSRTSNMREDLQQIDGINAEVEKSLYMQGVTRLSQIADWSDKEARRVDLLFGGMNRVHRERWVAQARELLGYPPAIVAAAAAPSAPPVPAPEPETAPPVASAEPTKAADNVVALDRQQQARPVAAFRSVRSEALTGNASDSNAPDAGHDLKRIRGIGVLIEKRLRAMGYTSYEQISRWTRADVDRISQQLNITGRIQRENWIEQARILAKGGQTEFARRMDRKDP